MIVASNSGHAEAEAQSWRPTLGNILDMNTPALFTTYNQKEALEEQVVFGNMGAHFDQEPEENRWHGLQIYLDAFESNEGFYYKNYYWYIVKGRK